MQSHNFLVSCLSWGLLHLRFDTLFHKYTFRVILNSLQLNIHIYVYKAKLALAIFRHHYFRAFRPSSGVQQLQVDQKC